MVAKVLWVHKYTYILSLFAYDVAMQLDFVNG